MAFLKGMNLQVDPTAVAQRLMVDVEVDPAGASRFFEDGDVDLEVQIVNEAGNVVALGTAALVALANRGDAPARYYQATIDLTVATGTNLAAGTFTVRAGPSTGSWTQTHPTTGATKPRSVQSQSHIQCRVQWLAIAALVENHWHTGGN
jgi:hypothetical protein